jgi:FkbM family methyltransferase
MDIDLIYDVGMHNGDDSAYYLAKGFRVVGIEANPEFCALARDRFAEEIAVGRMQVLNVGVGPQSGQARFYVNLRESQISTFAEPHGPREEWQEISVEIAPLSSIFKIHGIPYFAKIDVEHYDHLVLKEIGQNGITPSYVSAEAHTIETFNALLDMGYRNFKIVEGESVHRLYRSHGISTLDGRRIEYRFEPLSSGPFGEDVPGDWLKPDETLARLQSIGLGWIDIHAKI